MSQLSGQQNPLLLVCLSCFPSPTSTQYSLLIVVEPMLFPRGCLITFPDRQFWVSYIVLIFNESCMSRHCYIAVSTVFLIQFYSLVTIILILVRALYSGNRRLRGISLPFIIIPNVVCFSCRALLSLCFIGAYHERRCVSIPPPMYLYLALFPRYSVLHLCPWYEAYNVLALDHTALSNLCILQRCQLQTCFSLHSHR